MAKRAGAPTDEGPQPVKRSAITTVGTGVENVSLENRDWQLWGPYLSERQWRTVREDNTHGRELCHSLAHQLAYKWGEDGLFGLSDNEARLCCALSLWNEKDSILKERMYGLMPGNHGEDVKECYYYLDNTPSHCHMRALYKYPQNAFPYQDLADTNTNRTVQEPEYELEDTGIFDNSEYWDVEAEFAKMDPYTLLCQYTIHNRGPAESTIHILPTVWFRNTWSWGEDFVDYPPLKPSMKKMDDTLVLCNHDKLGDYKWLVDSGPNGELPELLFTENESNMAVLDCDSQMPGTDEHKAFLYTKDSFHRFIINGETNAVNPSNTGTKCASHYVCSVQPGRSVVIRTCLTAQGNRAVTSEIFKEQFEQILQRRRNETTAFYEQILPNTFSPQEVQIARQAYAGLLWSKQFYFYDVKQWLRDETRTSNPEKIESVRNSEWTHLINRHVILMPDKWEFPWYASWDLAFHVIPLVDLDPWFAKEQLLLMLSDGYMHPNGQLPAYEYAFSDVNPPVHAWACLYVYKQTGDRQFLAKCFHRLLLNFGWWVNTKDPHGKNLFTGGFLGLDNIAPINRSEKPPGGGVVIQADATGWMAFYSLQMLEISLELAKHDSLYSDMAGKFLQHFLLISGAINNPATGLWDRTDGFYYDKLYKHAATAVDDGDDDDVTPLKVHSLVGIVPIFACCVLDNQTFKSVPAFQETLRWFENHHKELVSEIAISKEADETKLLLSLPDKDQLEQILQFLFSEEEFLSPFGVRSLSKVHKTRPFTLDTKNDSSFSHDSQDGACLSRGKDDSGDGENHLHSVSYAPGESDSGMFGGNSNWRGPVWFCMNFLIIESLVCLDQFYGDKILVEFPIGSGRKLRLKDIAREISNKLVSIFLPDDHGRRPCHGDSKRYSEDPHWKELLLFHEFFHGDTGRGCGASHQTGWTALVINSLKMLHATT